MLSLGSFHVALVNGHGLTLDDTCTRQNADCLALYEHSSAGDNYERKRTTSLIEKDKRLFSNGFSRSTGEEGERKRKIKRERFSCTHTDTHTLNRQDRWAGWKESLVACWSIHLSIDDWSPCPCVSKRRETLWRYAFPNTTAISLGCSLKVYIYCR